jgi:nitrogen-specific signal transduction histidine kinase
VDASYRHLSYEGRAYVIAIFHDATERVAAETAQREAAGLRAATLLARAAAHEIHNPLAVIVGYLQLLQPQLANQEKTSGWIRMMLESSGRIREAVERLNRITRIESTPSRPGVPDMLDTRKSSGARSPERAHADATPGPAPAAGPVPPPAP